MDWYRLVFACLVCAACVTPAPAQNLISYYSFDTPPADGSTAFSDRGIIPDESGNGHDLTIVGSGLTWVEDGRIGGAARFDGTDAFLEDIDAGDYLNGLEAVTIVAWIRSDVVATDAGIVTSDQPDDNDQNLSLRYDAEGLFGGGRNVVKGGVRTVNGKQEYESRSYTQATTWQHLGMVYDSGKPIRMVVNGGVDTPTYAPQRADGPLAGIQTLRVGQGAKQIDDLWDGLIDELWIYEGALTPPEVRRLMEKQALPVELGTFVATPDRRDAVLEWQTLSETDNAGFEVEHRPPNGAFERVGSRNGRGTTTATTSYSFRARDLRPGRHAFRLRQVDTDGTDRVVGETIVRIRPEAALSLTTYPNPVRTTGTVELQVRAATDVTVELYNVLGQRVRVLYDGTAHPGSPVQNGVESGSLPSGVYFVRARTADTTVTRRLSIVR